MASYALDATSRSVMSAIRHSVGCAELMELHAMPRMELYYQCVGDARSTAQLALMEWLTHESFASTQFTYAVPTTIVVSKQLFQDVGITHRSVLSIQMGARSAYVNSSPAHAVNPNHY